MFGTPCTPRVYWRPGFREGWKMMDLPAVRRLFEVNFTVDVGNEKSWRSRAKVAFFPESEKMTRKTGRPCVKIKRPVFLPWGSHAYYENFGTALVGSFTRPFERKGDFSPGVVRESFSSRAFGLSSGALIAINSFPQIRSAKSTLKSHDTIFPHPCIIALN